MAGAYELQSPKDIAMEYGGNKQKIAQATQMGLIDPTSAVLAGMFIDRMRSAQQEEMAPQQTVAQQVMAPQMPPTEAGVAALPVPDEMVPSEFAGGGIVAFAKGGLTADDIERLLREAEQGRGPNVSRPQGINMFPQGLTQEDVPFEVVEEEAVVEEAPPSAGLGSINMRPIVEQATQMADAIRPEATRTVPTIQEASGQTNELLAASGYDTGVFDKIRQDVEAQRESLKGDRSEAVNMRLIEAGLGIMSGTSANAFENIGKGATGAMKGLSQDFKDIKKSERDLQSAQQNLMMKQNDAAMGKARITQSTIDKAQDRVDKELDNYNRNIADLSKTLLSGEIQERLAKATYSTKMTDFDKQWALYSKDAKDRGESPTLDGFRRALEGSRSTITSKEATKMAADALKNSGLDLSTQEGRQEFERQKRFFMQQGAGSADGQRSSLSAQDQQALNWANSNPNDPRAKQIKDYLGAR
jgi:hypothetical protein